MKKALLLVFLSMCVFLAADNAKSIRAFDSTSHLKESYEKIRFQARYANFFPLSGRFRDIYGLNNPTYHLEAIFPLPKKLDIWASFSYLDSNGKSDPLKIKALLEIYTANLGLEYAYYFFNSLSLRFGLGVIYSWLNEKPVVDSIPIYNFDAFTRVNARNGAGGVARLSLDYAINHALLFSIFTNYQYQRFGSKDVFQNNSVNNSGFYLGIGLGAIF